VAAIDATAVHLVTRSGSRLSIYRPEGDRGAALPWLTGYLNVSVESFR
jgi:hypothetical protein